MSLTSTNFHKYSWLNTVHLLLQTLRACSFRWFIANLDWVTYWVWIKIAACLDFKSYSGKGLHKFNIWLPKSSAAEGHSPDITTHSVHIILNVFDVGHAPILDKHFNLLAVLCSKSDEAHEGLTFIPTASCESKRTENSGVLVVRSLLLRKAPKLKAVFSP